MEKLEMSFLVMLVWAEHIWIISDIRDLAVYAVNGFVVGLCW